MKKLYLLFALVAAATAFLGCSRNEASASASSAEDAADALRIAIVSSPSGVDDGSFNQDNYNGILAFIASHPASTVTAVREPTGDTTAAVRAAADIVADYDALVCTGFQFAGIGDLARENPDTRFILMDAYPSDSSGSDVELENVYAMQFAEQESGFFAGIAAALETRTGRVAVVNGVAFPSNVNYQYGFECGVMYANKVGGLDVECVELASRAGTDVTGANVGGNYVGSFADPASGRIVAQQLMEAGVDIIFVAAGDSGNGVFAAVKESGGSCMVIGCDVDQWLDGENGSENIVLTSVLKNMAINIERTLEAIAGGTFRGANVLLRADTDSTGFVKAEGRHQMAAETISALDAAYELVKGGALVPASNFGGFTPEEFAAAL